MGKDLGHLGSLLRRPSSQNFHGRLVPGKIIDKILESGGEAGFTCPKCGEYTESSPCECGTLISQFGEEIEVVPAKDYDIELPKGEKNKKPEEVEGVEYEYNRKKFTLFSAKSVKNGRVSVHIKYYGNEYKITFTPWIDKMIHSVLEKSNGKFKSKNFHGGSTFFELRNILIELSRNPDKYNLSKLKVFKK